ncbi:MAG: hypothetical protein GXN98_00995 [Euryarchaeota archaeon]|nr:hypothetical protein [Euryarchaeota archaeon]
MRFAELLRLRGWEVVLLAGVYLLSLALRLLPKLAADPHLPAFQADVWYRIAMAQYILDHWQLPEPDLRYRAYGYVPMWYPPLSPLLLALGSRLLGIEIPVLCTRVLPFFEALTPLSIYFLVRHLAGRLAAGLSLLVLALTPSFVYWTGIADPQSFTLFMLPLYLLYWQWHAEQGGGLRERLLRLLPLGTALGVNFLVHLSYFLALLVMLLYTLALPQRRRLLPELGAVVLISQAVAAPWWLPRNLYWWWIEALVTSSGLYSAGQQLRDYGSAAALLGGAGILYLLRSRSHAPVLLWALPVFLESQNEVILNLLGMPHLAWETLAKPLEGFRFYPFLAQPAAVAAGVMLAKLWSRRRVLCLLALLLLAAELCTYGIGEKLTLSGMTLEEYRAALWFREHTQEDSRIIADYYRAQMFAGVAGGRALLGGMFPLRGVSYPYISVPARVQDDLYVLYSTPSAETAWCIARRYNATHIYYSVWMRAAGNLLSSYKPATSFGVEVYLPKFYNTTYFSLAYSAPGVQIFYVLSPEAKKCT